jgi:hypothetical protein
MQEELPYYLTEDFKKSLLEQLNKKFKFLKDGTILKKDNENEEKHIDIKQSFTSDDDK